ncbi:MAG: NAD(P)/FAD-dependent oxidoreductase [Thermoanaerobaculia bacterium]
MEVKETVRADVVVLGAGPGGSTLAAILAARGADVLLVERDTFPRDKLCGEFLSYDALPVLERTGALAGIEQRGARPIAACRVVTPSRVCEFALPLPARAISRLALDGILFQNAITHGARAMAGWTVNSVNARARTVDASRGETTVRIEARVLAGAWGRWGRIDRQLARTFTEEREHRYFGFKRHYRVDGRDDRAVELLSYRDGYLGVNAIEGGATNICGLVHQRRLAGHRGGWDTFVEQLRSEGPQIESLFAGATPEQDDFLSCEPVIFAAREPVEEGMFLVGDAAGIIDPLAGNGMAMAIQSAAIAAPMILARINREDDDAPLRAYTASWHNAFDSRLRWSRRIAVLLSRPALLHAAIAAVPAPSIGAWLLGRTRADARTAETIAREAFES